MPFTPIWTPSLVVLPTTLPSKAHTTIIIYHLQKQVTLIDFFIASADEEFGGSAGGRERRGDRLPD